MSKEQPKSAERQMQIANISVFSIHQKFSIHPKSDAAEKWRIFGNFAELKIRHFLARQCT